MMGSNDSGRTEHIQFENGVVLLDLLNVFCARPFFSLQSFVRHVYNWRPAGVAVSNCIIWYQSGLIAITCQIRYHSHLWDHRSTGQL